MGVVARVGLAIMRSIAERAGYEVLPRRSLQSKAQALYMKSVLKDWGITGVIDVGANQGQFVSELRRSVGFEGAVLSVEPIPELADRLQSAATNTANWRIEPSALASKPGTATFHITNNSEFSSFLQPREETQSYFHTMNDVAQELTVNVTTLDALLDRHAEFLGPRVYLKLDTQGYDLEVLSGLDTCADFICALQTEAAIHPLYEGAPDFAQSRNAIEARGFTISATYPNNAGHYPYLLELDCHFVRLDKSIRSFPPLAKANARKTQNGAT